MQSIRSKIFKEALCFEKEMRRLCTSIDLDLDRDIAHATHCYLKKLILFLRSGEEGNGMSSTQEELLAHIMTSASLAVSHGVMEERDSEKMMCMTETFICKQAEALLHRKKVVILTINAGNGHKSAAFAMEDAFRRAHGHDYLVIVEDIQVDVNTLYESSVKFTPQVYKWVFESTDSTEGMAILHSIGYPLFAKKLDAMLEEKKPDIIVSTYCFPGINTWLEKSLRAKKKHIPFIAIVTDSITVHHMWFADEIDHYIVANEDTKALMMKKGVDEEKIQVLGFPVSPSFYEEVDRGACMEKMGLDLKKPTFLVSVGTAASTKEVNFISTFHARLGERANLIVATGKNQHIYDALMKKSFGKGVSILGWTRKMYMYLQLADVVVTKAGGATVMECVALKKPMIITKVLPGQEEGNAVLVEKYGLGTVLAKNESLLEVMEEYIENRERIEATRKRFEPIWHDRATYAIVDFVISQL